MPRPRDFTLNSNEEFRKKELYRVFNFYIPLIRILEVGNFKTKSYKDTHIFRRLFSYVTSDEVIEAIIELWEANETMSSQFIIPFEGTELKQIIIDCIEMLEKTEEYK